MALPIQPGIGLGFITLGASIHDVLTTVKAETDKYPAIDVHYSPTDPLTTPVAVTLPQNGIRLRFDGADQRLRLIEVVDFRKCKLTYKGSDLIKHHEEGASPPGPQFKRVYQIFQASYPGEYLPPRRREDEDGTYILSWQGVAFTFPLLDDTYAPEKDHVSLLGSTAAGLATQMAIFEGSSWPEVRDDLFAKIPSGPRISASRSNHKLPPELEIATIRSGEGKVELMRRQRLPCILLLNETTPQDLITELGPPDAIHKRVEKVTAATDRDNRNRANSSSRPTPNGRHPGSQPSSYSSTGTDTFDTDFSSSDPEDDAAERASREAFWCYFRHGLDILVGPPSQSALSAITQHSVRTPLSQSPHLVVTKVVMHGNVPGSYAFNRHRRLRWSLPLPDASGGDVSSEDNFEHIKPALESAFADLLDENRHTHTGAACDIFGRGKVVNRTWGGDPSDSSFFLPDEGEDLVEGGGSEQWLGNTRLFNFPGLVFEVLESGAVAGVTVC